MAYDMLGTYTFEQQDSTNFKVSFEIPDNCFYNLSEHNGEYSITIKLNSGEKDPSTTFMPEHENLVTINEVLDTTFVQHEKTGIIRRPRIVINE